MNDYNFSAIRGFTLIQDNKVLYNDRSAIAEHSAKAAAATVAVMKKRARECFSQKWPLLLECWKEPVNGSPGAKLSIVERACMGKVFTNGEFSQRKSFWYAVKEKLEELEDPESPKMTKDEAMVVINYNRTLIDRKREADQLVWTYCTDQKISTSEYEAVVCIDKDTQELMYIAIGEKEGNEVIELLCHTSMEKNNIDDVLRYGEIVPMDRYMCRELSKKET